MCALVLSSYLDLFRVCLYVYSTGYVHWCQVHIWIYSWCVYMCTVWSMCIDAEFPFGFIQGVSICVQYRVCVLMSSSHLDLLRVCLYVYITGYVYWCRVPIWIYSGCVYMCRVQGVCIGAKFVFGFNQGVSICVQYRVCALVLSSYLDLFRVCLYVYSIGSVHWCRVHIWIYSGCVYMCTVQGMCIGVKFIFGYIQGMSICVQDRVCALVPSSHLDLFRVSICVLYGVCVLMLSSRLDLFMVCLYVYSIEHMYWCQVPIWIYSGCVYMCTV